MSNMEQMKIQHPLKNFKILPTLSCAYWETKHIPRKVMPVDVTHFICENGNNYNFWQVRAAVATETSWMTVTKKYTYCELENWALSIHLLSVEWGKKWC